MKFYNYFLFRLYSSFRDFSKEDHKVALISTAIFSCVFLCVIFYVFILFAYYWTDDTIPSNCEFLILVFGFMIFMVNYHLVIKKEFFLRQSFTKGKVGAFLVFLSLFVIGLLFVIGANKNREKLYLEKKIIKESINQG